MKRSRTIFAPLKDRASSPYLTPEDVEEALKRYPTVRVWRDVLQVLANSLPGVGAEDADGIAFVAWQGRRKD